jgi:hypothetical protein
MADDMPEAIERQEDRLVDQPDRILKQDEGLTLLLDAPGHDRPQFRSFQ